MTFTRVLSVVALISSCGAWTIGLTSEWAAVGDGSGRQFSVEFGGFLISNRKAVVSALAFCRNEIRVVSSSPCSNDASCENNCCNPCFSIYRTIEEYRQLRGSPLYVAAGTSGGWVAAALHNVTEISVHPHFIGAATVDRFANALAVVTFEPPMPFSPENPSAIIDFQHAVAPPLVRTVGRVESNSRFDVLNLYPPAAFVSPSTMVTSEADPVVTAASADSTRHRDAAVSAHRDPASGSAGRSAVVASAPKYTQTLVPVTGTNIVNIAKRALEWVTGAFATHGGEVFSVVGADAEAATCSALPGDPVYSTVVIQGQEVAVVRGVVVYEMGCDSGVGSGVAVQSFGSESVVNFVRAHMPVLPQDRSASIVLTCGRCASDSTSSSAGSSAGGSGSVGGSASGSGAGSVTGQGSVAATPTVSVGNCTCETINHILRNAGVAVGRSGITCTVRCLGATRAVGWSIHGEVGDGTDFDALSSVADSKVCSASVLESVNSDSCEVMGSVGASEERVFASATRVQTAGAVVESDCGSTCKGVPVGGTVTDPSGNPLPEGLRVACEEVRCGVAATEPTTGAGGAAAGEGSGGTGTQMRTALMTSRDGVTAQLGTTQARFTFACGAGVDSARCCQLTMLYARCVLNVDLSACTCRGQSVACAPASACMTSPLAALLNIPTRTPSPVSSSSGSKKGLYGLFGLLAIIPCICLSALLAFGIILLRKKGNKKGGEEVEVVEGMGVCDATDFCSVGPAPMGCSGLDTSLCGGYAQPYDAFVGTPGFLHTSLLSPASACIPSNLNHTHTGAVPMVSSTPGARGGGALSGNPSFGSQFGAVGVGSSPVVGGPMTHALPAGGGMGGGASYPGPSSPLPSFQPTSPVAAASAGMKGDSRGNVPIVHTRNDEW